ncbi:dynein regulatory complex subunit 3-like isoform X2 [Hylaeus volcanicus]|uniref:dynein regulatory complex subunit 3-like isoform X2 n=1 Tax=Hylaeus volcanicus TaxID=313075 RepID=UPI0023B816C1|nr:dynein regulatory complex subunit 3-like isoform X2 [Hylaeus volcanicus]
MFVQEDVPTILQEFVQPRTINQNMLINLIIDQGPKGEAGRLFYEDGINLNETKEIQIEFLNILNIDHLWVMPNLVKLKLSNNIIETIENLDTLIHLRELDLSFNHIRIMKNLNNLTNLEILLLYNNEISKIEGIDNLCNLTIFSIGNNAIADWEHVLYLRKLKKLRSFNINGNPCTKEDGYLDYVFAFMPQLIYYEYKIIIDEERLAAKKKHYRALTTLEETEVKEQEKLDEQQRYEEKLAFLTSAYMEHLDGDYLFQQMFADDKEGIELTMVNEETQNAYEEYKESFSLMCQELCEVGLKEHEKRTYEINLFTNAVNEGKEATQDQGRKIVNDILQKKTEILTSVKYLLKKLVGDIDSAVLEEITQKVQQLSDEFNDVITDGWKNLMSLEVELHEQVEVCCGFGDDSKIPKHLVNLCGDKDILTYNLANSHEKHLQTIDAREDSMLNRIKNWLEEYTEQLVKDESERNNQQILEISHFADSQQMEFSSLQLLQQLNLNIHDSEAIQVLDT